MTLTIEFTAEQEALLTKEAKLQGINPAEYVKRLVTKNLPPQNEQREGHTLMSVQDRIAAMDSLAEQNARLPSLSEEAFDRDNLYENIL